MADRSYLGVTGKRAPRWLAGVTAVAIVLLGLPGLAITPASAASPTGGTPGGFEIDGNMALDNGGTADWATVQGQPGYVPLAPDAVGNADTTVICASSKETNDPSTWSLCPGTTTPKNDIGGLWLYKNITKDSSGPHSWTYFAWDRGSGTGTMYFYLEFNQKPNSTPTSPSPNRTNGDVRLKIYAQGSGLLDLIEADSWQNGAWQSKTVPGGSFFGAVNTANFALPSGFTSPNTTNGVEASNTFYEIGFDLGAIGLLPACPDKGFGTINFRGATGESDSNLKDYVAPMPVTIPSTCATLQIIKKDGSGALLGGATFKIQPDPFTPNAAPSSFALVTDNSAQDADPAAGRIQITGVQPGPTYHITEATPPDGYIGSAAAFDVPSSEFATADPVTFTNGLGSVTWTKDDNQRKPLGGATFQVKAVSGAAADSTWNLGSNPITVLDNGATDQNKVDGQFNVTGLPTGSYQVRETKAPTGYTLDPNVGQFSISTTTPAQVSWTSVTPYTFVDVPNTSALTIEKLDATTHAVVPCPTTPTGCATFTLFQSQGTSDSTFSEYKTGIIVGKDGTRTVTGLPWGHYYYFSETAAPAGYNLPDVTDSAHHLITAAEADSVTADPTKAPVLSVSDSQGAISTLATTKVLLPGNSISDTVTLTGINNKANGTVTVKLYGPFPAAYTASDAAALGVCTPSTNNPAVFKASFAVSNVTGNTWSHGSGSYTPTAIGYYYWQASYTGDTAGNRDLVGVCGDPQEISEVDKAVGDIQTVASDAALQQDGKSHLPMASLYDSATLRGLTADAGGSVTFSVYGPYAAGLTTCPAGSAVATFTVNLPAGPHGTSLSLNSYTDTTGGTHGFFIPTSAGTYYWSAAYTGDSNNKASTEQCGSPDEDTTVLRAVTTTTTTSSQYKDGQTVPQQLPGVTVGDTATVRGLNTGATAGGTVTFALYPSSNGVCAVNPVNTTAVTLKDNKDGTGTASVTGVAVTDAGTYYWVATYSGDTNNLGSHDGCGDASEKIVVNPATPTIATTATSAQLPNASIQDSATLTGLTPNVDLTTKVTFSLYGPADPGCLAQPALWTSAVALSSGTLLNGAWTVTSGPHVVTLAGGYHWVASYEGDPNNVAVSGACGDQGETSTVTQAKTAITTAATDGSTLLTADPASTTTISDSAQVSGLTADAGGTVTFTLYGPVSDPLAAKPCLNGEPSQGNVYWTSSAIPLGSVSNGVATASTGPVTVTLPGTQNVGYFFWVASYSGDQNNLAISGVCPDPTERSMVTRTGIPNLTKTSPTQGTTVLPGDTIHYIVTLSNTGGLSVTSDLVDTLPVGVTPVAGTFTRDGSPIASPPVVSGLITWSSVTVGPGQTVTFAYDVTVNADVAAGPLTNTATWAGQSGTTVHTVAPAAPSLTKRSPTQMGSTANASGDVLPGDTIHYVLTLRNTGGAQVTSDLVDTLPSWLTNPRSFAVTTGSHSPATPTINGATLTWAKVTLAHGQTLVIEFDTTVAHSAPPGELVNRAAWAGLTDSTTHVVAPGVPTLDKASPTEVGSQQNPSGVVLPGSTVHYVLTLGNTGGAVVTSDLVDTLPTWVTSPSSFTVNPISTGFVASATPNVSGQTLTWPSVMVGHGQSVVIEFDAFVSPNAPAGNLVNSATWDELVSTATHVVVPGAPTIHKSSPTQLGSEANPSGVVLPGATIAYTVTVANTGGATVTSDLVDTLPVGVAPVDGSYAPSAPTVSGQVLTWTNVSVPGGQSTSFTFQVTVNAAVAAGNLVNNATWAGRSDHTVHVVGPAVPTLTKTSPTEKGSTLNPSGVVLPGSTVHYVLRVGNTGGAAVTSDLVDTLPAWMTSPRNFAVTTGSLSPATPTINGSTLTWASVTVAHGQSVVIEFDVTVAAGAPAGDLVNRAVWAELTASTTHVVTPSVPSLTKFSPTQVGSEANPSGDVNPGGSIHYLLTVGNTGGAAVTSDLVDTLPAGVAPVTASFTRDGVALAPDSVTGSTITWKNVTLASGATSRFEFDVTVDASAQPGTLVNTATWATLTDTATHKVVALPVIAPNPTLAKTADPASGSIVPQGQVITYTVKVGNTGKASETGDLVDTLPVGVVPIAGSYTKDGVKLAPDEVTATTITWKKVTVKAGQTVTFAYQVTVTSSTGGAQLVNTAKYLGLTSATTHTLATIPSTGGQLPKTGAPFNPMTVALWASMLLALGVMLLVFGRRDDENES